MQVIDLGELLKEVMRHSECMALFAVLLIVLFILHSQNRHNLQTLTRELREHTRNCPDNRS